MFIDIHIIQSVPLANLNRDDIGAPKSLTYGGASRLRVSSQSWKRAVRLALEEDGRAKRTYRTRNPHTRLAELLVGGHQFDPDVAAAVSSWVFQSLGTATKDDGSVILFVAESELATIATLLAPHNTVFASALESFAGAGTPNESTGTKKAKKKASESPNFDGCGVTSAEIAKVFTSDANRDNAIGLFGRMLASNPEVNVDAAVQVAHAFSTHAVEIEVDFFSAAEDIPTVEQGDGGAHLGSAEFATGTLYRYACIDVDELVKNCVADKVLAGELASLFVESFALSMPSGKKNSTAPSTIPALVSVFVREDRPVNLADSFETAVRSRNGYILASIDALNRRAALAGKFVRAPRYIGRLTSVDADAASLGTEAASFAELRTAIVAAAF